jgi:dUTP pyrophosphatase
MTDEIDLPGLPVKILRLPHHEGLELPEYQTPQSAGMDLQAAIGETDVLTIPPQRSELVPTGLCIALPPGYEAQIRPRSGLAYKQSIGLLNSPGTIDADYRGEIKVLLFNHGSMPFSMTRGTRIAQMIVARYEQVVWQPVNYLDETERGAGGFGHTGS